MVLLAAAAVAAAAALVAGALLLATHPATDLGAVRPPSCIFLIQAPETLPAPPRDRPAHNYC
jgi:hypothetical protein